MPRWETDLESRIGLEDTCVQCGYQPNVRRPTPEELKKIVLTAQTSHRIPQFNGGAEPDVFLCKRPGCGVWKVRGRAGRGYCSSRCWYLHRPEVLGKPKKVFWAGGLL